MPTTFSDGFINVNAFVPPAVGTSLTISDLDVVDQNDDGLIGQAASDTINGSVVDFSYPGDTITLNVPGVGNVTYTGTTFYLANGQRVFTPSDGQILQSGTFVSATATAGEAPMPVADFGPPCFTAGTMIATPSGPRKVEDLVTGDTILTADGATTTVLWLGHRTCARLRHGADMQPVRIRAGALGAGVPTADLTVTADHGMIIDDLVINAGALVNGSTIDWVPMAELPDRITFYHIETEAHDVILANGAPAETFVDYVERQAFDNYAEYLELYGAERIIPEMKYLRVSTRRLVPEAIKARFGICTTRGTEVAPIRTAS